jgi:hypothetical protein
MRYVVGIVIATVLVGLDLAYNDGYYVNAALNWLFNMFHQLGMT